MTCDDFRLRLTALSLGELEPGERQLTRDHLAACDDCASRVLVDRQLTALLRASAVPAPEATRAAVRAAVRTEAGEAGGRPPTPAREESGEAGGRPPTPAREESSLPVASPGRQAPRLPSRRRHWAALAAALLAAAAVVAAALLVVPAPDPGSPLSAAWSSYHDRGEDGLGTPSEAEAERLFAVLGPASRSPDLTAFGLRGNGWEARDLAGHVAAVAEYRDAEGGRVTLMRWRGDLPRMARGPEGRQLSAYRWGRHTSYWWRADGVVWCLVGTIDQDRLYGVAAHLGGES
jgi:anti-sigma factor RsiW